MVSAIVFAAGKSERAAEQESLLPLDGKPALQWVLEGALASDLREVICVVRDLDAARRNISLTDERFFWLVNYGADGAQNSSLGAGLWAIDPNSDGALLLVSDQPFVRAELIDALIERFENSAALIIAPTHRGLTRNPVLVRRDLFPELLKLTGEQGGRTLIEKYRDQSEIIPWPDEAPFQEVGVRAVQERQKEPA